MYAPATIRPDTYRSQAERTLDVFEQYAIAVFPSGLRRKGTYLDGWPSMSLDEAITTTRRDLSGKAINLAGRTGDGVAVFDLDAKNDVDPNEMLQALRSLVGPAIIAIVRTSRGFHVWLQVAGSVGNGFCSFIGGEIFSEHHLAMLPPSIHPSGHPYSWELEPSIPEGVVDLKALGLVPDSPTAPSHTSHGGKATPAPAETQQEFLRLMAEAGVERGEACAQMLTLCPWHDDRSPSLSINWDAAVYYCFSERCDARGGVGSLRRRLGSHTPSYRQWTEALDVLQDVSAEDHLSGDNLGCFDLDAFTERLAAGLDELGDDERARSVLDCRTTFRVGKCTSCARTPAFPISCGFPLCARCMPGRLAADWSRHKPSLPEKLNILMLRPRGLVAGSDGVSKAARARFAEWRKRAGVSAGIYGSRLDAQSGAAIMLAVPNDVPIPDSSRAFDVQVVAQDRTPFEFLGWLQSQYVDEAQSWTTTDELAFLIGETKGRRRFQGFGAIYGEQTENESKEQETMANDEATDGKPRRPLGRISGGAGKGKRETTPHSCAFCGGVVELLPFTVPAAEVSRVGNGWLWKGQSAGPPEGRRYAR